MQEALSFLAHGYEISLISDIESLDAYGLSDDIPCSVDVSNVTVRTALRLMLKPHDLTYVSDFENDAVLVTTIDGASLYLEERIYDFQDLLHYVSREGTDKLPNEVRQVEESASHDPRIEKLLKRAEKALDEGQFERAIGLLSDLIEVYPAADSELSRYYSARGYALSLLGENHKALSDCNRAIQLDDTNLDALDTRAVIHVDMGKFELAGADYEKLLRKQDGLLADLTRLSLARVYMYCGRHDDAIRELDRMFAPHSNKHLRYFAGCLRGYCHETVWKKLGDAKELELAQQDYLLASRALPDHPDAHCHLAWLLATLPVDQLSDATCQKAKGAANKILELTESGEYNERVLSPVEMPTASIPMALAAVSAVSGETDAALAFIETLDQDDPARFVLAQCIANFRKRQEKNGDTPEK